MYLFNLVGASCLATSLPGTLQNQFSRLGSCPPPRTCRQTLWNCERSKIFYGLVKVKSCTHSSVQRVPKFTIASLSSSLCNGKIKIFLILTMILTCWYFHHYCGQTLWRRLWHRPSSRSSPLKAQSQDQNHIITAVNAVNCELAQQEIKTNFF